MTQFRYRAINQNGKVISGINSCTSERELGTLLTQLNLELLSCKKYEPLFSSLRNRKITRRDIINYCFHMEQMTRSGISIIDALSDLQESLAPSFLSEVIGTQVTHIKEGKSFSEALENFPDLFGSSFISLINAGEKSGELSHVLKDLTETLTWQDELIIQTKKAITLPTFIAGVVFSVVFFLMTFLVPQMVTFITTMGHELPVHTKVLIAVSDFFVSFWYLVLIIPVFIFLTFQQTIKRSPKARLFFDRYKLRFWLFGPILEKIILARFVNYLALLYNSGIPVIDCLQITEKIVDNKAIELELETIRQLISEGASIGSAFEISQIFPRLVLSMVKVGEKTGDLGVALQNVSYFYKRDVDDAIENIQRLIEPAMTVILGAIIGWVMLSVLGPIYDLISSIKT